METTALPPILTTILGSSPFVLLLGWLFWEERKDRKGRDNEIKELNGKVLVAFKEQTKASVVHTEAIRENTKSNESLSSVVLAALERNGK